MYTYTDYVKIELAVQSLSLSAVAALPNCRSFTSPAQQPARFHACVLAAALLVSGVASCTVAMASLGTKAQGPYLDLLLGALIHT